VAQRRVFQVKAIAFQVAKGVVARQ
jgi:hypothetical protein